jgi:hypothetical protein
VRGATTPYRTRSMLGITLRRLARSYSALWGLCMVCGLMVLAALADVIAPPGRIPIYARVVRGSVLSVKENEYIEAVRALALRP